MGAPRIDTGPMTVADFLSFTEGRPDEERWELVEGEFVLNASPVRRHQIIVRNVLFVLEAARRRAPGGWEIINGIGVQLSDTDFPVPDLLVRPDRPAGAFCDDMIVAFEVLSPSTRGRDLRWKRRTYAQLPSLQHYVVISPDALDVVSFDREAGFAERRHTDRGAALSLAALSLPLPLAEIYRDVHWDP